MKYTIDFDDTKCVETLEIAGKKLTYTTKRPPERFAAFECMDKEFYRQLEDDKRFANIRIKEQLKFAFDGNLGVHLILLQELLHVSEIEVKNDQKK